MAYVAGHGRISLRLQWEWEKHSNTYTRPANSKHQQFDNTYKPSKPAH
jgi:hypothetical protein